MKVLVTGGTGFLGRAVCQRLLTAGYAVRSLARHPSRHLDPGIQQVTGDLRDTCRLRAAVHGCQAVVHTAARASIWGARQDFHAINAQGTERLLAVCRTQGVERFVHTSSASVVFNGDHLRGADESQPYPRRFLAPYPWSKAIAERAVLAANSPALATTALRVHLIWGPGDPHFLPQLLKAAGSGRLSLIGDGTNLIDTVYIDNAADAHLAALERLTYTAPPAGKAYFITQGQPVTLEHMVCALLRAAGAQVPSVRHIPHRPAAAAARMAELLWRARRRTDAPPLTRFLVAELAHDHYFDISAARRDLRYRPTTSIDAGLARLADACHRQTATHVLPTPLTGDAGSPSHTLSTQEDR
ncbi:NAD-dependent epimerase/dehydratase family protein [Streptomyces fulvorobeus]|uniref:3-beta hydroxysteroid dehydrogenase n=1 Tax=Streptomyces fulvorobeus TaxID=284028 RepID=A0A7J0C395_9ACTN|nr:NAD-dependent epimerase/dehydratase family protein [Streptomyces fulvorobeus]NYE40633.1 nucleoside-diphosphate-sugar epimerase [Streptomyces fulvorobeus]GFM96931.1 3-beta hydroxysteroid dehydrogenase [Streptomyces fulvorobeus]